MAGHQADDGATMRTEGPDSKPRAARPSPGTLLQRPAQRCFGAKSYAAQGRTAVGGGRPDQVLGPQLSRGGGARRPLFISGEVVSRPVLAALFFGLILGFLGAIPVAGPVSAMVIERALDRRFSAALLVAIGSALAEGIYAFLAILGFSAFADLPWVAAGSKAVAAVVLIAVGLSFALRRAPAADPNTPLGPPPKDGALRRQWFIGFSVTIVNPTLLATWGAAASMLIASEWVTLEPVTGVPFGLGVAIGASSWFALLVLIVKRFTHNIKPSSVRRIIRGIGWALVGIGAWMAVAFVRAL